MLTFHSFLRNQKSFLCFRSDSNIFCPSIMRVEMRMQLKYGKWKAISSWICPRCVGVIWSEQKKPTSRERERERDGKANYFRGKKSTNFNERACWSPESPSLNRKWSPLMKNSQDLFHSHFVWREKRRANVRASDTIDHTPVLCNISWNLNFELCLCVCVKMHKRRIGRPKEVCSWFGWWRWWLAASS